MSDPTSRLPARPSVKQLRKQAKELLRDYHTGDTTAAQRIRTHKPQLAEPGRAEDVTLADAQFALARECGFESWAKLVRHVEALPPAGRLEQYERLAQDYLGAYAGDADALQRLGTHLGVSYTADKLREKIRERLRGLRGPAGDPTLADIQFFIARQYGFENWAKLAEGLAQPPGDVRALRLGHSSSPPFYKIDARHNTIEPRPPLADGDWDTIFGVMKELGITGISAASMTDGALESLARLEFVTRVNVGGARQLTDDGLRHLAHMPQLEELDLSGYHSPLTDRGLEVLRHLKHLRRFQMCWPQRVTDAGVANLACCEHLESVNLLGTPTGDGAVHALAGKRQLHHFKTGRLVTDAGLPPLHEFPAFKTWQGGEIRYGLMSFEGEPTHLLLDGPFTGKGLAGLAGLHGLFGLSFFWHASALTADGLKPLADLPNLGFLGCQGELCNDEAMRHIGALPRLRMLMGQGTVAGDDGFAALSRSQTIEYIWGRECPNLTGRGFAALAGMPALRGLAVSCKNVDDAALAALPRFPALRELMPMDVPDDGFRHVGRCERLESLVLMYCRDTTDVATGHIADLSRLKTYYAGSTQITDRSLEILGRMPSLERLDFEQCAGITNAGLAYLAALPRLREVGLGGSPGVTREGFAVFPAHVRVNYWA
jgi:hypothetical protein